MSRKRTSCKKSSQDKYHDICNYCKSHWATKCSKRKIKKTKNPKNLKRKFDIVEKNENGNNVTNHLGETFVIIALSVHGDGTWYVNSNASMHLCHKRNWYFESERISPIKIYMGSNSTQEVVGKGKM